MSFVEFYITSNPPLRPSGVKYVLEQVQKNQIPVSLTSSGHGFTRFIRH